MSDGRSYRKIVHPGNPQTPDDSPWAAFKDGYIENVPIDASVHSGWVERAIRSIGIFKHVKPIAEKCLSSRTWPYRWLMWAWRIAYMGRHKERETMWGVIEERHDGKFVAYHVVPMVDLSGELVPSDAHVLSNCCHCHPYLSKGQGGWDIFNHFDPDHSGAMEAVEFIGQKRNWVN